MLLKGMPSLRILRVCNPKWEIHSIADSGISCTTSFVSQLPDCLPSLPNSELSAVQTRTPPRPLSPQWHFASASARLRKKQHGKAAPSRTSWVQHETSRFSKPHRANQNAAVAVQWEFKQPPFPVKAQLQQRHLADSSALQGLSTRPGHSCHAESECQCPYGNRKPIEKAIGRYNCKGKLRQHHTMTNHDPANFARLRCWSFVRCDLSQSTPENTAHLPLVVSNAVNYRGQLNKATH